MAFWAIMTIIDHIRDLGTIPETRIRDNQGLTSQIYPKKGYIEVLGSQIPCIWYP